MMRGERNIAVAVRRPDGQIDITSNPLAGIYKGKLRETAFIRGIIVLIETMALGIQALLHSAEVASFEETHEKISPGLLWGTAAVSIIFGIALFFVLPLLITNFLIYPFVASAVVGNLLEGIIRLAIFILYLWLISLMPDIKRVFAYHGAEHKVINAYEAGISLESEQIKKYSKAHARCGTNFLLVVLVIAIIIFTLLGRPPLWLGILYRIILIPIIAAISYEFIKFSAVHRDNPVISSLLAPGLLLQSMTTREPVDGQIETAIVALNKVIEADNTEIVTSANA